MKIPFKIREYFRADHVAWLQGGEKYFALVKTLIDSSKQSIFIQTYILEPDKTGNEIMASLINASKRGVSVFLLVDAFGSANLSKALMVKLIRSGIKIRKYSPFLFRNKIQLGRRLHHKIMVFDSKTTLIGGINIANKYRGIEVEPWLDFAVKIEGTDTALEAENICKRIYERNPLRTFFGINTNWSNIPKNQNFVQLARNDWMQGTVEITRSYRDAIRKAENYIFLSGTYFLPDYRLKQLLTSAAKRGVKIQLVFSEESDIALASGATRYLYHWLLQNNIELFEWPHSVLHAKVAIIDDYWVSVGSYNINPLSKFGGIELNANIFSEEFSSSFRKHWNYILHDKCNKVIPQKLSKKYSLKYYKEMFSYYFAVVLFRFIKFIDQL